MTLLAQLYHSDWWMFFVGCCAFAVLCALARVIGMQADPLPAPDERAIVKERLWRVRNDAWDVSPGHTRYQEE